MIFKDILILAIKVYIPIIFEFSRGFPSEIITLLMYISHYSSEVLLSKSVSSVNVHIPLSCFVNSRDELMSVLFCCMESL